MANDHEYLKNRYEIVSNVAKNYVGVKNVTLQIEILQFSLWIILHFRSIYNSAPLSFSTCQRLMQQNVECCPHLHKRCKQANEAKTQWIFYEERIGALNLSDGDM